MRRHPSVDRIEQVCNVDRATAIKARRVIDGRDDPLMYPGTKRWADSCFNPPRQPECVEAAVNELLDTYGIEAIHSESAWRPFYMDIVALYANSGDTYSGTMLYDVERGVWYATTWGDWVETAERNRRYTFA